MTLNKGLVGHWTMDDADTSGGTLYDSSAYDNHGVNNNITTSTPSPVGEAYTLDGSNGGIELINPTPNQISSSFSITTWCSINSGADTSNIFSTDNDSFRWRVSSGDTHWILLDDGQQSTYFGSSTVPSDQYIYYTVVYDSSIPEAKFYINGELDDTISVSQSSVSSYSSMYIGAYQLSREVWDGELSDLRLYNRVLTEDEIYALYNMRSQRGANVSIFPERAQNTSFDQDSIGTDTPTGWTDNSGNWIVTDTNARGGSGLCFGNTYNGTANGGSNRRADVYPSTFAYQQFNDIKPDQKYRVIIYLYSPSGSGNGDGSGGQTQFVWEDDGRLRVTAYNSSNTQILREETLWMGETTNLNPYEWNKREVIFTTPTDTDYIRVNVDGGDGNNSVIDKDSGHGGNAGLFIDDLSVKEFTK